MKVAKSSKKTTKIKSIPVSKSGLKKTKTVKKAVSFAVSTPKSKTLKHENTKARKHKNTRTPKFLIGAKKLPYFKDEVQRKISIADKSEKQVNITIADSPLDSYLSPHILDLSNVRFIEKVKPTPEATVAAYSELPGGDVLSKLYIFELLSFEDSEIIGAFKKIGTLLSKLFKRKTVDFSGKLSAMPAQNPLNKKSSIWEETVLINLIGFIVNIIAKVFYAIGAFFKALRHGFTTKDEDVSFTLRPAHEGVADEYDMLDEMSEAYNPRILAEFQNNLANSSANVESFWTAKEVSPYEADNDNDESFIQPRTWQLPSLFSLRIYPRELSVKAIIAFVTVAVVIILPIKLFNYAQGVNQVKGQVLGETEQAVDNLQLAQQQLMGFNFERAGDYFATANQHFTAAGEQLNSIKSVLTILAEKSPISNAYRSGKRLLDAGTHLSLAGEHLIESANAITDNSDSALTEKIKNFNQANKLTLAEFKMAASDIEDVNINHIPEENREQFKELTEKLPVFIASLEKIDSLSQFAVKFLGDNDLKRYLIVFQNDNELRATGGFMGSFALVDLKSGQMADVNIPAGGTYDVRAGFNQLIQAPKPMQLLTPRWEFQDANWWPDWPTSAKSIAWFYQKSNGPTIDGVIAINSDWMKALLKATGPIDMPEYKTTISAENFEDEVQQEVEIDREDKKQPKKILSDLAPKLVERIFNIKPENILGLASALNSGLNGKDILIYLSDLEMEKFVIDNNWDGRQIDTDLDYLNVVATNIGGGKTDNAITQDIYHRTEISADGSIIDTVLIKRQHSGAIDENFTNQANRSYLRIYVPKGSKLINASGFVQPLAEEFVKPEDYLQEDERLNIENDAMVDPISDTRTYEENNKTVFANWLIVEPGQSQEIVLVYKLPFKAVAGKPVGEGVLNKLNISDSTKDSFEYGFVVQKQAGSESDDVTTEILYSGGNNPKFVYPKASESNDGQIIFNEKLDTDIYHLLKF